MLGLGWWRSALHHALDRAAIMTHNDGAELVKRIGSACFKADRFRKRQVSATAHQLGMIPLPMHILNIDGFSPVRAPVPDRSTIDEGDDGFFRVRSSALAAFSGKNGGDDEHRCGNGFPIGHGRLL